MQIARRNVQETDRVGQRRKRDRQTDSDDKRPSEKNGGKIHLEKQIY